MLMWKMLTKTELALSDPMAPSFSMVLQSPCGVKPSLQFSKAMPAKSEKNDDKKNENDRRKRQKEN
uniref:Uncharacterized protein n=1 Tax=Romanomermis culicivorax TaxID=13658 RepID=A0A915K9G9_ROMCU